MINNFFPYKKLVILNKKILKTYNKKHFLIQLKKPNIKSLHIFNLHCPYKVVQCYSISKLIFCHSICIYYYKHY